MTGIAEWDNVVTIGIDQVATTMTDRLNSDICEGEWALTEEEAGALEAHGECFAAGFLLGSGVSIEMRHANGLKNHLLKTALPQYSGELLYPADPTPVVPMQQCALWPSYVALDSGMDQQLAAEKLAAANDPVEKEAFSKLLRFCETYPRGGGFTHSIINYGRVLAEGLDSYAARIRQGLSVEGDPVKRELLNALLVLTDSIENYLARCADYLDGLSFDDEGDERNRRCLVDIYKSRAPMRPASSFREAIVATSFLWFLDGSDNLGRFDQFIWPYYRDDLGKGTITRDDALDMVRTLWRFVDLSNGWNTTLGGSDHGGAEASNELTLICLEAAHGRRRPNLALRVRRDTPERVWDAALDLIATGNGLPAIYSEENYLTAIDMARIGLDDADRWDFAFGGCTELMVQGVSNVGSLDADLNVLQLLSDSLQRNLRSCRTFDELPGAYENDVRAAVAEMVGAINKNQEIRGLYHPQLIRSLLVDDCVDRGRSFYSGGARYNWSVVNIAGLSNVIDSLTAIRIAVYEDKTVDPDMLLSALEANFQGHDELRRRLLGCPKFGNDDPEVNDLAHRLSGMVYQEFKRHTPWRGGKFICGTLMFITYGWFGKPVPATPDGRLAGEPVGDSAGPVQGRDRNGPTAMLNSVTSLQQLHAPGTLVVNLRVAKELVNTQHGRNNLNALIRTYFSLGGMQLQINVVDQELLKDAIEHPEKHQDLIIRIGGYSEYFNNLEPDLKVSILQRTEHGGL